MIYIPKKYEQNKNIPKKDFILKDFKPDIRKKLTEYIKKIELKYQIYGEDLSSVINEDYNIQAIQVYNFEIKDIKNAGFIANIYQQQIKSLCILSFSDNKSQVYSFALKRLNKNDNKQIVVEHSFLSESFSNGILDFKKDDFEQILHFDNIKNKTNKKTYYEEIFIKAYILKNIKACKKIEVVFGSDIWYNNEKVLNMYSLFKDIVESNEALKKVILNSDAVKINEHIAQNIQRLNNIIY